MIPPRKQWCANIDVTNACPRRCSNCTRLTAHVREPFFMDLGQYEAALQAYADFPYDSENNPDAGDPPGLKRIGMMGGEPLVHPQFSELCSMLRQYVPERRHRALFTGVNLDSHPHGQLARATFGYINQNEHDSRCEHQPVLVAVGEVIRDDARMRSLIEACPLQRLWSCAITPKGFFFCEIAGVLDLVFQGPGGLPVTPGCWRHDLADYRDQIEQWCPRCGVCLPLAGRLDSEERDDITPGNLEALRTRGSPRVLAGEYVRFDPANYCPPTGPWRPLAYLKR